MLKLITKSSYFTVKKFIELIGCCVSIAGLMLLAALVTYSPEDPNFIFTKETEIKNILGFNGSVISDIFFQSIGLISILIAVTIFITGINVVRNKKTIILIENLFFIILYSLFGSLFFAFFNADSFWLSINGNGGFVGKFLEKSFLSSIIDLNQKFSFYFLIIIIFIFFFIKYKFSPNKILVIY